MNDVILGVGQFMAVAISAIIVENAMMARGLGTDRIILITEDLHSIFNFGTVLTIITTLSCGATFFLDSYLKNFKYNYSLQPLIYITVIAIVFLSIRFILKTRMKGYLKISKYISVAVFNCAVLGSMLIVSNGEYNFIESIGFGVGTGFGYMLAMVFVSEGNRYTKNRNIPSCFKGLPLMLVYIGVLSMALHGLLGYRL